MFNYNFSCSSFLQKPTEASLVFSVQLQLLIFASFCCFPTVYLLSWETICERSASESSRDLPQHPHPLPPQTTDGAAGEGHHDLPQVSSLCPLSVKENQGKFRVAHYYLMEQMDDQRLSQNYSVHCQCSFAACVYISLSLLF